MALWQSLMLWVFHALYNLSEIIIAVCHVLSVELKQCDTDELLPRAKLPAHLAVAFTTPRQEKMALLDDDDEEAVESMLESAKNVMHWCSEVGISMLTFYDRNGLLKPRFRELHAVPQNFDPAVAHDIVEIAEQPTALSSARNEKRQTPVPQEFHGYLTPPTSDDSPSTSVVDGVDAADEVYTFNFFGTRVPKALEAKVGYGLVSKENGGLSTVVRKRRPLQSDSIFSNTSDSFRIRVNVVSETNGIPAIAQAARTIALTRTRSPSEPAPPVPIQQMDDLIHAELAPPELLILHHMERRSFFKHLWPRAMDMFPPWQLRLTEIHFSEPRYVIEPFGWFSSSKKCELKYPLLKKGAFAVALNEYSRSIAREGK